MFVDYLDIFFVVLGSIFGGLSMISYVKHHSSFTLQAKIWLRIAFVFAVVGLFLLFSNRI